MPASASIVATSSASTLVAAMTGPGANVTGASFVTVPAGTPHAVSTTPLAGSPTNGPSFAILTTGDANLADTPNTSTGSGVDLGGGNVRGDTDFDVSILKVDLNVQPTANCLSFDFKFLSEEYPEYVGTQYNDAFIAEMDTSNWTTSGSTITAPNNFAFDAANHVVSVNAVGLGGFSAANAAGTTYDGATQQLSAAKQVTPGAHSLYLSIFDQGDHILDSAAFVDNLRVGWVPDPATQCKPGAVVKNFQLDLTPATATEDTGTTHTVTATLKDPEATPPELNGQHILFTAGGANSASGSGTTNVNGQASFSYTGTNVGVDAINACYDFNNNNVCDTSEVFATAQVTWVNPPPTNDAGGPYSGNEGSAIGITGTANDPNGDTLTNTWSYAPVAGVDAGATCSFGSASALSTTVTCTDDGTYRLTLTTSDGVNTPVTDTADLTVANVAPVIGSVTTPVDPTAVGTPTALTASYSDAGSNDTHTASIDWGDGTTTTPAATAGAVSDSHTYASAGTYTVCLTVTDDDGASDTECSANYVVIYDPSAGFVTGGGWITAPAGSYPANPSASGPGRFGFVSKYQKGASIPVGNTEFQFQAGDLNFHSSSYDWLVIAGAKALYKGTGTVNGHDGYKFLVSAIDGSKSGGGGVDKFRIKIWNASTSTVVFDNQIGAADDATATTAITKGSIVIHN
jgi:PKD repeat protein